MMYCGNSIPNVKGDFPNLMISLYHIIVSADERVSKPRCKMLKQTGNERIINVENKRHNLIITILS